MPTRKVQDHVEIDKDDARGGHTGDGVRMMLIVSIALALAGFAAVALLHGG
jgi:hypothetical protein